MEQFPSTHVPEKEQAMKLDVQLIKPEGLGYGKGAISLIDRQVKDISDPEYVSDIQFSLLDNFVNSSDVLVPVDKDDTGNMLDDDGCGDGRGVGKIFKKVKDSVVEKARSLRRAKIFGGAPVMSGAGLVANGEVAVDNVEAVFTHGISALKEQMIDFGAHTDDHAEGEKCGCGAIDNAPVIFQNAITFKDQIAANIDELGVSTNGLSDVFSEFEQVANLADKPYSGQNVMNEIVDSGKIVKELEGGHKEVAVVLNMVEGQTVNQEKAREVTDGKLQLFAVDVWRLVDLTQRLYPDDEQKQQTALQGMLVYTLATAATLTKGDLPVYRVQAEEAFVTA